ncbi:DUF3164 family protein [Candidatus Neomarinimicrobiota bacterium]
MKGKTSKLTAEQRAGHGRTNKPATDGNGNWQDGKGEFVPPRYIDRQVKERDRVVRRAYGRGLRLQGQLIKAKRDVVRLVDDYLEELAGHYSDEWKGNAELVTFDGRLKLEVKVSEGLEFDERLQLAKQKIDDCLRRWSGGAREEIKALIGRAFQVDTKGRINVRSILTLRQFRFDDQVWQEAMDMIADSLRVKLTRRYINIYEHNEQTGRYELLQLNWSSAVTGGDDESK